MDKKKCMPIFRIIDQLIESSDPLRAEYLRGYRRGTEAQVFGVSDALIEEHHMLIDYSFCGSGDSYIDSYARGYHDGFEGLTAESPSLPSKSSKSLNIASIV